MAKYKVVIAGLFTVAFLIAPFFKITPMRWEQTIYGPLWRYSIYGSYNTMSCYSSRWFDYEYVKMPETVNMGRFRVVCGRFLFVQTGNIGGGWLIGFAVL